MKRKLMFVFLMACILLSVAACTPSKSETPAPSTNNNTTTSVSTGTAISIESFAFNPKVLTVPVGSTVVWTNNDSAKHNVVSTNFSSPEFGKGETFEFKFDQKGTYDYSCGIHPSMTGKIIVE